MANPIVVEIDAQDNSKKTLEDFANNLKSANAEAAKAAESFRKTGQGAKNMGDALRAPGRAIGDFGKGLQDTAKGMDEFLEALKEAPKHITEFADNAKELAWDLGRLGLAFERTRGPVVKLGAALAVGTLRNFSKTLPIINSLIKATRSQTCLLYTSPSPRDS